MTPEERIKRNVAAALGQQARAQVNKHNIFIKGVLKSALRTKSTDLAEIIQICETLPVSDPELAALALTCCHNNTQIRLRDLENSGEDIGVITFEQMSRATGEEYSPEEFARIVSELAACGVLFFEDGYYRVTLYKEDEDE